MLVWALFTECIPLIIPQYVNMICCWFEVNLATLTCWGYNLIFTLVYLSLSLRPLENWMEFLPTPCSQPHKFCPSGNVQFLADFMKKVDNWRDQFARQ